MRGRWPILVLSSVSGKMSLHAFLSLLLNHPITWVGFAFTFAMTIFGISITFPSRLMAHLGFSRGQELEWWVRGTDGSMSEKRGQGRKERVWLKWNDAVKVSFWDLAPSNYFFTLDRRPRAMLMGWRGVRWGVQVGGGQIGPNLLNKAQLILPMGFGWGGGVTLVLWRVPPLPLVSKNFYL